VRITPEEPTVLVDVSRQTYPFSLPNLPYPYEALEPSIDKQTMQFHHDKHHATYVTKLNEALAKEADLHSLTLEQLLVDVDKLPESIRAAVRHNGGGHLNHDFFWNIMGPVSARKEPRGALGEAIKSAFGAFAGFKQKFSDAAAKHFASGWLALALDNASKKLEIVDLNGHDVVNPRTRTGVLILDVWEHAYYLKYQNRRPEFIEAWWNVVNWDAAEERFARGSAAP
jgi:Fe-Mn family superoxide dismutase